MKASADSFGKIIDLRQLWFNACFYHFSEKNAHDLLAAMYDFINVKFGKACIIAWDIKDRVLRKKEDIYNKSIKWGEPLDIYFMGDVISKSVYNKTSLRAYENKLGNHPIYTLGLTPPGASVDYPEYARQELEPYIKSPDDYRDAVSRLFSQEGRVNLGLSVMHDLEGGLSASVEPGNESNSLMHGSLDIMLSCFSLDSDMDEVAEMLYDFGRELSLRYSTINTTIGICTGYYDYGYFGYLKHSCSDQERAWLMGIRAKDLYMNRVGWANIISPKVASLFDSLPSSNESNRVEVLESGAVCLRCVKALSQTTLKDLKQLKFHMYPALFPGGRRCRIDHGSLRSNWEIVPVLDSEITVEGNEIIFQHSGEADEAYLLEGATYFSAENPLAPKKRKPTARKMKYFNWELGDVFALPLRSEDAKEAFLDDCFLLIHYIAESPKRSRIYPKVVVMLWMEKELPKSKEQLEQAGCLVSKWNQKGEPCFSKTIIWDKQENFQRLNAQLIFLGNYPDLGIPPDPMKDSDIFACAQELEKDACFDFHHTGIEYLN